MDPVPGFINGIFYPFRALCKPENGRSIEIVLNEADNEEYIC